MSARSTPSRPSARAAWRERLQDFERAEGRKMTRGHNFKPHLLFPVGRRDRACAGGARRGRGSDRAGHPPVPSLGLAEGSPARGAYVSWHQDATYFALEPVCHVTAWVALTDAPVESGCMEVVPGSHKLGQLRHADMQDTGEPAVARPDAGGRGRSLTHRLHGGEGRAVLAAPHAPRAQFAAQPLARTAASGLASATSRPGALHRAHARHRHAGARRGQVRPFRRRAPADPRPVRRNAPSTPRRWRASGR